MPAESKFDNLTNGNYVEWKIYMEALLVRKNLLEVVNGTKRHPGGNEGTKKVKDFYRKQAEAHAKITLHVSPSQLVYCRDTDPYQIWMTLTNAHQARGHSTILALHRCFHCLHLEKTETITAYIACVHYVAFLLEEAKVKVPNDDVILAITAGLPHSYDDFLMSLCRYPYQFGIHPEHHHHASQQRVSKATHVPICSHPSHLRIVNPLGSPITGKH